MSCSRVKFSYFNEEEWDIWDRLLDARQSVRESQRYLKDLKDKTKEQLQWMMECSALEYKLDGYIKAVWEQRTTINRGF